MPTKKAVAPVQTTLSCLNALVGPGERVKCRWGHKLGGLDGTVALTYLVNRNGPKKCQTCKDFEGAD